MDKQTRSFRYDTAEQWHKGNLHIHSTASDGGLGFDELAALYATAGYRFLFRTDHWVASDAEGDNRPYPLLWLDGMELDGADPTGAAYHVVCLGAVKGITQAAGLVAAMNSAREQGALLFLAHPHWTGNSLDDALRWPFDGVEIYNHVCRWLNGKSEGSVHWSAMLARNPATLAAAVDDAHLRPEHPGWNGGWIMVNSVECNRPQLLDAIRRGNYYSSCGPEFHSIEFDGVTVSVRTSPVQFARLVGSAWQGKRLGDFSGKDLTHASFSIPADWNYACLEIEDRQGRRAWTNTLFVNSGVSAPASP